MKNTLPLLVVAGLLSMGTPVVANEVTTCAVPPAEGAIDHTRMKMDIGFSKVCITTNGAVSTIKIYGNMIDMAYQVTAVDLGNNQYQAPSGEIWKILPSAISVSDSVGVIWTGNQMN